MKIIKPAELAQELGIQPGDTVEITSSPIERPPNWKAPSQPPSPFEKVRTMTRLELHAMGCRQWDEADAEARILMLFPAEWYDSIPEGFVIVDINMREEQFKRGETDDDRRFGLLAFGVVTKDERRSN